MDVTPYFDPGQQVTARATAAVTGGTFVAISADLADDDAGALLGAGSEPQGYPSVAPAAGVKALGVATKDADTDESVPVVRTGAIVPVIAGNAITAGAQVETNAAGRAIPLAAGVAVGHALSTVAADGDIVMVAVY